jgi:hypothetical protein
MVVNGRGGECCSPPPVLCGQGVRRQAFLSGVEPRDDFGGGLLHVGQRFPQRLFAAPIQLNVVGAPGRRVDATSSSGRRRRTRTLTPWHNEGLPASGQLLARAALGMCRVRSSPALPDRASAEPGAARPKGQRPEGSAANTDVDQPAPRQREGKVSALDAAAKVLTTEAGDRDNANATGESHFRRRKVAKSGRLQP